MLSRSDAEKSAAGSRRPPQIRRPTYDVNQRPFLVIWEVTRACDLACVHCRAEALSQRNPLELSTAQGCELIDQIADFGSPLPLFVITGGDPLKRPDLLELVAHAHKRGLPVAFSPSATPLLTADKIAALKNAGVKALSLSLDGASPETHDAFRRVDGVFDRTMAAWSEAQKLGLKVQINTTVAQRNLLEMAAIANLVRDRGAILWSVFFLVPVGRATTMHPISPAECEDLMHFLYEVGKTIAVKTTEAPHFRRIILERVVLEALSLDPEETLRLGPVYGSLKKGLAGWDSREKIRRPPMDVNAGQGFVFISHVGEVHPSGFLPAGAGNVRNQPLTKIYRESAVFNALRDDRRLRGRCGECEFREVCGGSRSRAYAATGDYLGEDPLCSYVPRSFPYQSEIAETLRTQVRAAAGVGGG